MTGQSDGAGAATEPRPRGSYAVAMLAVLLANSAAAIAYAALTVALADIATSLGIGEIEEVWLPDSFLVAVVCVTPLTAYLVRRLGGRRLLYVAISGLVVTAAGTAAAPGAGALVALLFVQGLFAAPIPPATQAFVVAVIPPRMRSTGMAMWSGGTMAGILAGSVLGGYLTEHFGWRSIFFLVPPLGAAALVAVRVAFSRRPAADTASIASLDLSTIADANLAVAATMWFIVSASSTGIFETVMLGSELGFGPETLGVINAARGGALLAGVCLGAVAVQRFHALGASIAGLVILCGGKFGYTLWGPATSEMQALWPGVVSSIGYGMLSTSLAMMAFVTVAKARSAAAASVFVFSGVVGSALGVAVLDAYRAWADSGVAGTAGNLSSYTDVFFLELLAAALLIPLALSRLRKRKREGDQRAEDL